MNKIDTKPILRSRVTTRTVPEITIEEEKWECSCGLLFSDYDRAKSHYGEKHAYDRSVEIRDYTFYLISSQNDFDCWKQYQLHVYGDYYMASHDEWDGPGWYCSQIEPRRASVYDGDHYIIKASVILKKWQRECDRLQEEINEANFVMNDIG